MASDDDANWSRNLAFGVEVAVGIALGYFVGSWCDRKFGSSPWGMIVGILLGCAAGMYLLIKQALGEERK